MHPPCARRIDGDAGATVSIWWSPFLETDCMTSTAKLFTRGRSQTVRLPKAFRFEGREMRVRFWTGPPDREAEHDGGLTRHDDE